MSKECIILAGGMGTRLQSVVNDVPKCMAKVSGVPFLQHIFDYLEKEGIQHIILSLGYKADVIIDWISTQQRKLEISYVVEEEPLGTGGAIRLAFSKVIGNQSLVLNGDTFFNICTKRLFDFQKTYKADISIALKPMSNFDRYGTVNCDDQNKIIKFNEKQYTKEGLINGGVYLVNREVFSRQSLPDKFSFEKDILETQLEALCIYGLTFDDYFIDIGIPTDFAQANIDFSNNNHLER